MYYLAIDIKLIPKRFGDLNKVCLVDTGSWVFLLDVSDGKM
jgi:hypothetical protein